MKNKTIFLVVITILIVVTASIMVSVVENVSGEMEKEKSSPASNGSFFVYSFQVCMSGNSFYNKSNIYYNETLKHADINIIGRMYINITDSIAYFHSLLYNCTGGSIVSLIVSKTFSEPLNGTIFTSLFPDEHLRAGYIMPFGNNLIAIKGMYTNLSASNYVLYYGHTGIEYVPYVGMVESISYPFPEDDYSFFKHACFIQSNNYSILDYISIPGNSSIAAMILGNIGIKTSWFTMSLNKTNVAITAINYTAYIEKYTIAYVLIWIAGIGYLLSLRIKKR